MLERTTEHEMPQSNRAWISYAQCERDCASSDPRPILQFGVMPDRKYPSSPRRHVHQILGGGTVLQMEHYHERWEEPHNRFIRDDPTRPAPVRQAHASALSDPPPFGTKMMG
ncbi:hypothetical protein OIDMADRAFT_143238 [Oidiodendron maius Zn]|uniref:Uncharacterized protein n=1 Tax=Oidiodendron maius (strain Zn) TaxID=913774 RepID=A0A0C3HN44_OIDMZ|nr:hypothetical protein OIDMADRAFT_143238 [Oidiodendron maius Zn]